MKIQQVVVLVLLSALCPVAAKLNIFTGATGGNGSITCSFTVSGDKKFFCKDDCKGENVLVETDGVTAENGRHSVRYTEGQTGSSSEKSSLVVTIRNLTKSDSGRYRCGIGETSAPQMYTQFGVRVVDDPVHGNTGFSYTHFEGETFIRGCRSNLGGWKFFCRGNCNKTEDVLIETNHDAWSRRFHLAHIEHSFYGLYVAISNVISSDSGWYRCGHGRALSSASFITFPLIVIPAPDPSSTESPPVTTEEASDAEEQDSTFPTVPDPSSTESPPVTTEEASDAEEQDSTFPKDPGSTESPPVKEASAAVEQRRNCPSDALVYVVAVLVIIIIILGLALALICTQRKWRSDKMNIVLLS